MSPRKIRDKKIANAATPTAGSKLSQSEIRKRLFIRAIQSQPICVYVGPSRRAFHVPEELLIRYSLVFEKMLRGPYKESVERSVELSEDSVSTFEDFLVWIHSKSPCIDTDADMNSLIGLAVFADRYFVHFLKNQISDVMRTKLAEETWKPTPDVIRVAYEGTPAGSILRRLCSLAFTINCRKTNLRSEFIPRDDNSVWKPIFSEIADFGWDYFENSLASDSTPSTDGHLFSYGSRSTNSIAGGACSFHDHSDVPGWKRTSVSICPYLNGRAVEFFKDEETSELRFTSPAAPRELCAPPNRRNVPWLQFKDDFELEIKDDSEEIEALATTETEEMPQAKEREISDAETLNDLDPQV